MAGRFNVASDDQVGHDLADEITARATLIGREPIVTGNEGKHGHVENDLAQLKGIGARYAELLKSIGVDSIKELRRRNLADLKEMIETRYGKVVGLSEVECKTWIDEARAHG
jgi:predicted flap endonuclease-1-like 5' DNA nuclease